MDIVPVNPLRTRESLLFAAYATAVFAALLNCMGFVTGANLRPTLPVAIFVLIPTFIGTFFSAFFYLRKRPLRRLEHGVAIGAIAGYTIYCTTVLWIACLVYFREYRSGSQFPIEAVMNFAGGAFMFALFALPVALIVCCFAGAVYVGIKFLLRFLCNLTGTPLHRG